MFRKPPGTTLILTMVMVVPALALCRAAQAPQTLILNGQPTQITVVQMNGHSYVDVEALARAANGSLSFNGDQMSLTLPTAGSTPAPAPSAANLAANSDFSKGFMRAGIEQMTVIREWRTALANAVQNGFPITDDWLSAYRSQATTALHLSFVAVSTDSDRNAYQLLNSEFENMKLLSNNYVALRQSMQFIAPDSLGKDPLNQKIINCAHSMAAMAANGQFVDDGSCQ
ncbi:MAG TPA: hypothetical protein VK728_08310 [Candidatus Sulfotelmatobacter sp.]|jgi:hypothetical protein|nr:hypothetical protein [Candidatus Sulfotelmatobacter sp.]